ncbi:TPA: reprolysin-like metallopeptidase [Aeromonas veronii]
MMKFTINVISVVIAMSANIALASPWHMIEKRSKQTNDVVRASVYTSFKVDEEFIQNLLAGDTLITLPLPNGEMVQFEVQPSSVLPPALAAKYPGIMTFKGHEVGNEKNTGSFDISPRGFNGMFMHAGEQVFIDVQRNGIYAVYYKKNAVYSRGEFESEKHNEALEDAGKSSKREKRAIDERFLDAEVYNNGNAIRVYKIAISATSGYTAYHGSKENAIISIATLLSRVNDTYERDLGVKFELAEGNEHLIYDVTSKDPFFNGYNPDKNAGLLKSHDGYINENVQRAAYQVGLLKNFDIGHVLTTADRKSVAMGKLCADFDTGITGVSFKGRNLRSNGMSSNLNPIADAVFVNTFSHELGHMFGAGHTFNAHADGRNAPTAWEPGSGSSIMGYAGLFGSQDVHSRSEGHFHSKSIEQMLDHIKEREKNAADRCGQIAARDNQAPSVEVHPASQSRVIPANTAFMLSGSGVDNDNDPLTFTWEQVDLGDATFTASQLRAGLQANGPVYRYIAPTTSPVRHFPSLATQLKGEAEKGDVWVNVPRTLNFRLVARDGKGGGAYEETSVEVVDTGSQTFKIEPASDQRILVGSPTTVNWQVAGTDRHPVNCQRVDISYSNDEGKSWQPLVNGVSNNGAHEVTIPANAGSAVRLKLACSDNIFYAITPKLATKSSDTPAPQPESPAPQPESNGGGGGGGSTGLFALLGLGIAALLRRREIMSY